MLPSVSLRMFRSGQTYFCRHLYLLVMCLTLWNHSAYSLADRQSPQATAQTPAPAARQFDAQKLKNITQSSDFNYFKGKAKTYSLLERIEQLLASWLNPNYVQNKYLEGSIYVVAALLLAFALFKIFGIERTVLFQKTGQSSEGMGIANAEEWANTDFESALQHALAQSDYRAAIRYAYLLRIRQLDVHALLVWKEDKTNYELQNELTHPPLRAAFQQATYWFERIYYGGFQVEKSLFERADVAFQELDKNMRQR